MDKSSPHPILLYDGVCGLCNRLVQFILRRDGAEVFQFASLQSSLAKRILERHATDAGDLDSVYVVVDVERPEERVLARSDAVIFILQQLRASEPRPARSGFRPGATRATPETTHRFLFWRLLGKVLQLVPRKLRDWGYRVIARNRYRLFGRYDSCPLPTEETRWRFLDLD